MVEEAEKAAAEVKDSGRESEGKDEDLGLTEEIEREDFVEDEKATDDNGSDFFSQDPVEMDEPDEKPEASGEAAAGERVEKEKETSPDNDDTTEKAEEDQGQGLEEEAVHLDEGDDQSGDGEEEAQAPKTKPFLGGKLKLVTVGICIGVVLVAGGFFLKSRLGKAKQSSGTEESSPVVSDPLVEEKLKPFFVLVKIKTSDAVMAKIDISVKWKRIVSIRYKESAHQVRAEIYGALERLLREGLSPNRDKGFIIERVRKALNNALGVNTVQIASVDTELI